MSEGQRKFPPFPYMSCTLAGLLDSLTAATAHRRCVLNSLESVSLRQTRDTCVQVVNKRDSLKGVVPQEKPRIETQQRQ